MMEYKTPAGMPEIDGSQLISWRADTDGKRVDVNFFFESLEGSFIQDNSAYTLMLINGVYSGVPLDISSPDFQKDRQTTKIYTALPPQFYKTLVTLQCGLLEGGCIAFPTQDTNKNITVRHCFSRHPVFKVGGTFHPDNWHDLGWSDKETYQQWLTQPILTAFSQTYHFCKSRCVFSVDSKDGDRMASTYYSPREFLQRTIPILSVTELDCRGMSARTLRDNVDILCTHVEAMCKGILDIAQKERLTDIVMVPFGVVFSGEHDRALREHVNKAIAQRIKAAFDTYAGTPLICLHFCGDEAFHRQIGIDSRREGVFCQAWPEVDPFSLAVALQNKGRQSVLINKGHADWMCKLDPEARINGVENYTLRTMEISQYYGLMTWLVTHDVYNLIAYAHIFDAVKSLGNPLLLTRTMPPATVAMYCRLALSVLSCGQCCTEVAYKRPTTVVPEDTEADEVPLLTAPPPGQEALP